MTNVHGNNPNETPVGFRDAHRVAAIRAEADRHRRDLLLSNTVLYLALGLMAEGWVPGWLFLFIAPVCMVRWMIALHELFHLRAGNEVDPVTRSLPLALTPLSLGYDEYRSMHGGHHRYMATPEDPEWYQLAGTPLRGFLGAITAPEQSFLWWWRHRGFDVRSLGGVIVRLCLFLVLAGVCGWSFLWYWIPVRVAVGIANFSFFYTLHRRGESYGAYSLPLQPAIERLFIFLFGRDACMATCNHDIHHTHAEVFARDLPEWRGADIAKT